MVIVKCLNSSSYKETDVFAIIIIIIRIHIDMLIVTCVCLCGWLLVAVRDCS
jgi:hypothetical protein